MGIFDLFRIAKSTQIDITTKTGADGSTLVLQQAKNNPAIRRWQIANPETPMHEMPYEKAAEHWKKHIDPTSDLPKEAHKLAVIKAIALHHQSHGEARQIGHVDTHGEDVLHPKGIKESYREGQPTVLKETTGKIKEVDEGKSNKYEDMPSTTWVFGSSKQESNPGSPDYPKYREAGMKISSDRMSLNKSYMESSDNFGTSRTNFEYHKGELKVPIGFAVLINQVIPSKPVSLKRDYGYIKETELKSLAGKLKEFGLDVDRDTRGISINIDNFPTPERARMMLYDAGESISFNVDGHPYRVNRMSWVQESKRKNPAPAVAVKQDAAEPKDGTLTAKTAGFTNESGEQIQVNVTKHPKYGNLNLSFSDRFPRDGELSNSLYKNGFRWSPRESCYFNRDNAKADSWLKEHFGYGEEKEDEPQRPEEPQQPAKTEQDYQNEYEGFSKSEDPGERAASDLHKKLRFARHLRGVHSKSWKNNVDEVKNLKDQYFSDSQFHESFTKPPYELPYNEFLRTRHAETGSKMVQEKLKTVAELMADIEKAPTGGRKQNGLKEELSKQEDILRKHWQYVRGMHTGNDHLTADGDHTREFHENAVLNAHKFGKTIPDAVKAEYSHLDPSWAEYKELSPADYLSKPAHEPIKPEPQTPAIQQVTNPLQQQATMPSRFSPSEAIQFKNPISGPSGAKLTGYQWKWRPVAKENHEGDEVVGRESDWDNALESSHTGREIVHHFTVQYPDGRTETVSLESAAKLLGHDEGNPEIKSLSSNVKGLVNDRLKHSIISKRLESYEQAENDVRNLERPEITSEIGTNPYSQTPEVLFRMGDAVAHSDIRKNHYGEVPGDLIADKDHPDVRNHIENLNLEWEHKRFEERGHKKGQGKRIKQELSKIEARIKEKEELLQSIPQPAPAQPIKQDTPPVPKPSQKYGDLFDSIPDDHPASIIVNHPAASQIEQATTEQAPVDPEAIQAIRQDIQRSNERDPEAGQMGFNFEGELPPLETHKSRINQLAEEILPPKYRGKPNKVVHGPIKNNPLTAILQSKKNPKVNRWQSIPDTSQTNLFASILSRLFKSTKAHEDQMGLFGSEPTKPTEPKITPSAGQVKQFGNNPNDTRILQQTKTGVLRWFDRPEMRQMSNELHSASLSKLEEIKHAIGQKVGYAVQKFGPSRGADLLHEFHDQHRRQAESHSAAIQDAVDGKTNLSETELAMLVMKHHLDNHHADEYQRAALKLRQSQPITNTKESKPEGAAQDLFGQQKEKPTRKPIEQITNPLKNEQTGGTTRGQNLLDLFDVGPGRKEDDQPTEVYAPALHWDENRRKPTGIPTRGPRLMTGGEGGKEHNKPQQKGKPTQPEESNYEPFTEYDEAGVPKGVKRFEVNLNAMVLLGKTLEFQSFAAGQFEPEDVQKAVTVLKSEGTWTYQSFRSSIASVVGFDRDRYNTLLTQMPIRATGGDSFEFDPDHDPSPIRTSHLTPEQKNLLKSYTGWGGTDIQDANEFYTPSEVVKAQWDAMRALGYKGGIMLEPSCGTGRYIDHRPTDTIMVGVELDPISAFVAKVTHTQDSVMHSAFEQFSRGNQIKFNGTIANVPFGDRQSNPTYDQTSMAYGKHEDYFILKSLQHGAPGSVHSFIVPTGFLENKKIETMDPLADESLLLTEEGKKKLKYSQNGEIAKDIQAYGEFVGAIRLPNKTFRDAGTSVTSDVVFFRRRPDQVAKMVQSGKASDLIDPWMSSHYFKANEHHIIGERTTGNWGSEAAKGDFDPDRFRQIAEELAGKKPADYSKLGIPSEPIAPPKEGDVKKHNGQDWIFAGGKWTTRQYATELGDFSDYGYTSIHDMKAKFQDLDHAMTATHDVTALADHPVIKTYDPRFAAFLNGFRSAIQPIKTEEGKQKVFRAMMLGRIFHSGYTAAANGEPFDQSKIDRLIDATKRFTAIHGNPKDDKDIRNAARINSYAAVFQSIHDDHGQINPVIGGRTLAGERVSAQKHDPVNPHSIMKALFADSIPPTIDEIYQRYTGGKSKEAVESSLLEHPEVGTNGTHIIPFNHAVSGQVYDKIDQYRKAMETATGLYKEKLQKQIEHIEQNKPDVNLDDIRFNIQSKYVPVQAKNDFISEYLDNDLIRIREVNGTFIVEPTENETRSGWRNYVISPAHEDISISAFEDYLNGVSRSGRNDDLAMLDEDFRSFIESNPEHQGAIKDAYLKQMKNYVEPEYSMAPMEIPGFVKKNPKTGHEEYVLHPYQYASIRKFMDQGRGIISLDVGLGKSSLSIAISSILHNTGQGKRSAFAVEKNNISKFFHEITEWSPDAKVAVVGYRVKKDKDGNAVLDQKGLTQLEPDPNWDANLTSIATGAHTHIIIPHSVLSPSTNSDRYLSLAGENYKQHELDLLKMTAKGMANDLANKAGLTDYRFDSDKITTIEELAQEIDSLAQRAAANIKGKDADKKQARLIEKSAEKIQKTLKAIRDVNPSLRPGKTGYGNVISFENLGIDHLFLDEAHNFKSLFDAPDTTDARGESSGLTGTTSNAAVNMFMLSRHLLKKNNNRGVFFMTATPITAKPHESFNLLSMVAPDLMKKEFGIDNVTDFMNTFANVTQQYKFDTSGNVELASVVNGFKEANGFRNFLFRLLDMKNASNATVFDHNENKLKVGLKLPVEVNHRHIVPPTEYQKEKLRELISAINAMVSDRDKGELPNWIKETGKRGPRKVFTNMDTGSEIGVQNLMQRMDRLCVDECFDPHSNGFDPENPPERFKVLCSNIAESYKKGGKNLVFLDGFNFGKNGDYHKEIANYLTRKHGIPAEEIALIQGNSSEDDRYKASTDYREGRKKVIIGGTAMETGMDLQMGTTDIHHFDQPWNSTNIQQRNGRGVRQGNPVSHVNIHHYFTENGYDFYRNMTQQRKAGMLDHLYNGTTDTISSDEFEAIEKMRSLAMLSPNPERALKDIDTRMGKYDEMKRAGDMEKLGRDTTSYNKAMRRHAESKEKHDNIKGRHGNIRFSGYDWRSEVRGKLPSKIEKHNNILGDYSNATIRLAMDSMMGNSTQPLSSLREVAVQIFPDSKEKQIKFFKDIKSFAARERLLKPETTYFHHKGKNHWADEEPELYNDVLKKAHGNLMKSKKLADIYREKVLRSGSREHIDHINNDDNHSDTTQLNELALPSGHFARKGRYLVVSGIEDESKSWTHEDTNEKQSNLLRLIGNGHKTILNIDRMDYDQHRKDYNMQVGARSYLHPDNPIFAAGWKVGFTPNKDHSISLKDLRKDYRVHGHFDTPEEAEQYIKESHDAK